MESKVFIIFAILSGLQSSTIYPRSEIIVKAGEGFSTFLSSDSEFGESLECQIKLPSQQKPYNVPKPGSGPIETEAGTIEAFEESQCGAGVRNITKKSEGYWELVAIDKNLQRFYRRFYVTILDEYDDKVDPQHLVGDLGGSITFICYHANNIYFENSFKNCLIKDLQTGKEERLCKKKVFYPEFGKTKKYLCLGLLDGSSTLIKQEVFVEGQPPNKEGSVQQSVQHLNKSTVMSCQFEFDKSTCFAIHLKSGLITHLNDNLMGSRYSSHKTNRQKGLCQLEIPHPIKENETGTWKIVTLRDDSYNYNYERYSTTKEKFEHGCFFNIESDGIEEVKQLRKRVLNPQKIKTLKERITIKCEEAPYELKYCYLITPDKTAIYNTHSNFEYTSTVGSCIFHEVEVSSGIWKCGYNSPDENSIDIVQDIQIEYFPKLAIKVETPTVKIDSNDSFSLMCRTVVETPIKSCMFISPNGDIYYLTSSSNKFYYGRGLDAGDCGISLSVSAEDSLNHLGAWSCNVQSYTYSDRKLYGEILVQPNVIDKTNDFEEK